MSLPSSQAASRSTRRGAESASGRSEATATSRAVWLGLAAAGALLLAHEVVHWDWYIDDAAISFAYARNLADGEGLVGLPGGERIEGYSNPTWVVLLTLFELVGLSGFTIAKPMAAGFSLATMGVVYRLACKALPGRPIPALLAPFALSLNAQFALWTMSALENSLFCFLLALGVDRVLEERDHDGIPWSSVVFLALAWTRPEGLMYAAIGGAWYLLFLVRRRGSLRWVVAWLLMFWVPYLILEALRTWYFAWPLANTYYAKVGVRGSYPLHWHHRGWEQAREYAARLWHGWFLPLYLLSVFGTRGKRGLLGTLTILGLGALLLYPGPVRLAQSLQWWPTGLPTPLWFLVGRIWILGGLAVILGFVPLGRPGGDPRAILWHMGGAALFFSIYANGDWMDGYRWMSLLSPSAAVLFALGVVEVADRVAEWAGERDWQAAGWTAASIGIALLIPPNFNLTRDHRYLSRNETPHIVKRRGDYTTSVARRTFYDGEIVNLEMDQGAHMWWYPHYEEVDMAGLIDISMSRHRYHQRPFIQEYVLEERQPTFAHVHGNWALNSGFKTYDDWHQTYFELPRYDDKWLGWHDGVWARRDLFVRDSYAAEVDRHVVYAGGVELMGMKVPVDTWSPGHYAFVELALRTLEREPHEAFSPIVTLSNGDWTYTYRMEPGYGLYPMHEWEPDDIYVGGVAIPLPEDTPTGPLDVGVVIIGPEGEVLPAGGWDGSSKVAATAEVGRPGSAHVAVGEARFPGLVTVEPDGHEERVEAAVVAVQTIAGRGDCDEAEAAWIRAKRHRPIDWAWHRELEDRVGPWLAGCWAKRAEADPDHAVSYLARAHDRDHHHPELERVGGPIGDRLWREGLEAREAGDHEVAYRRFTELLSFQPWRSWARRYAEEARDERLGVQGIDDE